MIFNGFAGYSLPDDLLSATGLRIAYSILLSIPFVGTWLASLFFGGAYPGPGDDRPAVHHPRADPARADRGAARRCTSRSSGARSTRSSRAPGAPSTTSSARGCGRPTPRSRPACSPPSFAVVAALGGLAQINPIWLYGPYRTGAVTTAAQPDWYMGWLEGALRIFPAWRIHLWNHTIPELFWPGVVLPGLTFALLYAWPFIEARVTRDHAEPRAARSTPRPARSHRDRHRRAHLLHRALRRRIAGHLRPTPRTRRSPTVDRTFRVLLFVAPLVVGGDHVEVVSRPFGAPLRRGRRRDRSGRRCRQPPVRTGGPHPSRYLRTGVDFCRAPAGVVVAGAAIVIDAVRRRRVR